MRNEMKSKKVRLGISVGDVNGIGLEVVMKAFSDSRIFDYVHPSFMPPRVMPWLIKKKLE